MLSSPSSRVLAATNTEPRSACCCLPLACCWPAVLPSWGSWGAGSNKNAGCSLPKKTLGAVWGPTMLGASDMRRESTGCACCCWPQLCEQSTTSSSWSCMLKRCLHWIASTLSPVCWATHLRKREWSRCGSQTPFLSTHDDHCDHSDQTTEFICSAASWSTVLACCVSTSVGSVGGGQGGQDRVSSWVCVCVCLGAGAGLASERAPRGCRGCSWALCLPIGCARLAPGGAAGSPIDADASSRDTEAEISPGGTMPDLRSLSGTAVDLRAFSSGGI